MAAQHGVASTEQARALGVSARVEMRRRTDGTLYSPCAGVLAVGGCPVTFMGRAMAATFATGVMAVSHGAAARLHGLDGFDRHETIDVIAVDGANPRPFFPTAVHYTRGPVIEHTVRVEGIPVMSVGSTLALLAPHVGYTATARAFDSALRLGVSADELQEAAVAWRKRGRSGPRTLLELLHGRTEARLPRSWFQRLAARVLASVGVRLIDEFPVRDQRGVLIAELDLAEPVRRIGVEAQSWRWHGDPSAQHRDARRRGALRQLGWEIVDVWWADLRQPERVIAELSYLIRTRPPNRWVEPTGDGRSQTAVR